ncbi:MAG TPA: 4Fe-4S binding protein [Syntrophorhabdaceae bacterium]|nr:4Fe-4S binding protein [Syntrophorhabdaceae bacterium]
MEHRLGGIRAAVFFLVIVLGVIFLSSLSSRFMGGKTEEMSKEQKPLTVTQNMTIEEFGKTNGLSNELLKEVFAIAKREDLQRTIAETGISNETIISKVTKVGALHQEFESKNWILIPTKFGLWFAFLLTVFIYARKGKIKPALQKVFYLGAVLVFGVILGSDPSSMGTVKDSVVLFAEKTVIFPPRIIALSVFLLIVFVANKFICAWGCQFGALQDIIFRVNRKRADDAHIYTQVKLPYALTNSIRITTFVALAAVAFLWSFDIIGAVDPFKIFKPSVVAVYGWVFIGALLVASLFIYRPWCHLFCPFGLVSWFVEKISRFKIQVNYDTCIACETCAKACPSSVMEAILKRKKMIPDCFSCTTCIGVCPTNSISFKTGRRAIPPEGKFEK